MLKSYTGSSLVAFTFPFNLQYPLGSKYINHTHFGTERIQLLPTLGCLDLQSNLLLSFFFARAVHGMQPARPRMHLPVGVGTAARSQHPWARDSKYQKRYLFWVLKYVNIRLTLGPRLFGAAGQGTYSGSWSRLFKYV